MIFVILIFLALLYAIFFMRKDVVSPDSEIGGDVNPPEGDEVTVSGVDLYSYPSDFVIPPQRKEVFDYVADYSAQYNLSKKWLLSVIEIESQFRVDAQGDWRNEKPRSFGLLQIQDSAASTVERVYGFVPADWKNSIAGNLEVGSRYANYLIENLDIRTGEELAQAWTLSPDAWRKGVRNSERAKRYREVSKHYPFR